MFKFTQFQSQFQRPRVIAAVAFHVFALFVLVSCGTKPQETPIGALVETPPPVATRLAALTVGELTIENECLIVNDYLLVWPPDFTVTIEADTVEITDERTGEQTVWHSGDTVPVGGGGISYFNLNLDEQVRQGIPASCTKGATGPFWLVGGVAVPPTVTPVAK